MTMEWLLNRPEPGRSPRTGDEVAIPGDYQHKARLHGPVVQRFWHAEKERVIRKYSLPRDGERVLDVGCGSGVISDVLAACGGTVTAIDGSEAAIAYARRTFKRPNLEFRRSLVEEIDIPPASLDRVYCLELVEHLYAEQVNGLMLRLARLTRQGGTLLLTTPNYRGVWPLLEKALDTLRLVPRLQGDQHVTRFNADTMRALMGATGWRVETLTTFSTVAPFLSVLGWTLAERVAAMEDSLSLPFGNILLVVAHRE